MAPNISAFPATVEEVCRILDRIVDSAREYKWGEFSYEILPGIVVGNVKNKEYDTRPVCAGFIIASSVAVMVVHHYGDSARSGFISASSKVILIRLMQFILECILECIREADPEAFGAERELSGLYESLRAASTEVDEW